MDQHDLCVGNSGDLTSMIFGFHYLYLHIRNVELQRDHQVWGSPVDMTTNRAFLENPEIP